MSQGYPPPPPRDQDPAQGRPQQPYDGHPQPSREQEWQGERPAYREQSELREQQEQRDVRGGPLAAGPAGYVGATTVVDARPVGPAPALMLALGILAGLLVGLVIAYALWHSAATP